MTFTIPSNENSQIQIPTMTEAEKEQVEDIESVGVSAAKAAVMLDVCERTIWNMVKAGTIRSVRIGRRRVISAQSIRELIDGKKEPCDSVGNSDELREKKRKTKHFNPQAPACNPHGLSNN